MYLITLCTTLVLSSLMVAVLSERISAPKYLFSSESDIPDLPEEGFVASQLADETPESLATENEESFQHERVRRAINPPPPTVSNKELCEHSQLVIRWTDSGKLVSTGAIVALCREGTDRYGKKLTPLVFVSNDHGSTWNNVTDKFKTEAGTTLSIDTYYNVKSKPNFIIFTDKVNKRIYYSSDGLKNVQFKKVTFRPEYISINPDFASYVIATDNKRIYLSKDGSRSYNLVQHLVEVAAYYWGSKASGDKNTDIFVEGKTGAAGAKTQGYKLDCGKPTVCSKPQSLTDNAPLNGDIIDFLVKKEYMFVTKRKSGSSSGVDLYVKYRRDGTFVKATVRTTSPLRELFVYDVSGGVVMLVANHRKNETNLYISLDKHGKDYSLSLPRVLYHNPHTDVSSHWLRRAVAYRFVDVRRVQGLPWVYFATQLTVGPVGGRYLISMMTFDKGGLWQRIRGPPRNRYGQLCAYPSCSLHVNLFYGSIYRYSRTTPLMSRESAPGLIMTTGVVGVNLKITPNTYISRDGGKTFNMVLRAKKRFAYGDHGGVVVATEFDRSQYLLYSFDFKTFSRVRLHTTSVQMKKILTEPGEKSAVFLVLGTVAGKWRIFKVNLTQTLGSPCRDGDFSPLNLTDAGTGGCEIRKIQQRNASRRCLVGPKFTQIEKISYENCRCRRRDYRCDVNFKPTSTGGCQQMSGTVLIPKNCPEGQFFNKSRGYARIQGHNCIEDNTTRESFTPLRTPCPVEKLGGLNLQVLGKSIDVYSVGLNQTLKLSVNLTKGYLPHINFKWKINGLLAVSGVGRNFMNFSKKIDQVKHLIVQVEASNTKSLVNDAVLVIVQRKLKPGEVMLGARPGLPSVKESVDLFVKISTTRQKELGGLTYKWQIFEISPVGQRTTPKLILQSETSASVISTMFNTTGRKSVVVTVYNKVSRVEAKLTLIVTKDLKVKNVRLSNIGGNIMVKWDDVNEPTYRIERYRVLYAKQADANRNIYHEVTCSRLSLQCLITGTTPYTKYQVVVDTMTKDGYGPRSDPVTIMTPMAAPSAPLGVKLTNEGPAKVEASWKPPLKPNGIITGYTYKFYKTGSAGVQGNISNTKTSISFDNLEKNEDYHFWIAAFNKAGTSERSETMSVRTGYGKPTLPPTDFIAIRRKTSVKLTWNPPKITKSSNIFFAPKGYNIYMMKDGSPSFKTKVFNNQFNFTNLSPNTTYNVAIAAFVTSGEGPMGYSTFKTLLAAPDPPSGLKIVRKTSTVVSLSWTPQGPLSLIKGYEVYQLVPSPTKGPLRVNQPKVTVTRLTPYTNYTFAVKAVNDLKSSFSNKAQFTTDQDTPGKPSEVFVSERWPTSSSVLVEWKPPTHPNGIIQGYKVKWYADSEKDKKKEATVSGKARSFEIDHLRQETQYHFEVYARTKVGFGEALAQLFHTRYYPFGTERQIVTFVKPDAAARLQKEAKFEEAFIKAVADTAKIDKKRIADVTIKPKNNSVQFELISNEDLLDRRAPSDKINAEMTELKKKLSAGFEVLGYRTKTLKSLYQHPGEPGATQTGNGNKKEKSSSQVSLIAGISAGAVIVILILVVALVVLFRRYRNKSFYNKFDNQFQYNQDDDTIRSVNSDTSVEMHPPSHRRRNKDIERVPLADADELT